MHDSMVLTETWTYECLSCLHEWTVDYQVGHCADGHGGAVVYYRRGGLPCTSPWTEPRCPACGHCDVKIMPIASVRRPVRPR